MKKYFSLQLKRVFRYFPYVLAVSLVLFLAVAVALWGLLSANEDKSENTKVKIGIAGSMEDEMVQMGLRTFESFDDTKYSLELLQLEETEAASALSRGEISAYVVVPEDFAQQALRGNIMPVRFVTTAETTDIVTLFKNEILDLITDILVTSQKGTYGIGDALRDQGYGDLAGEHINKISLKYLAMALSRTDGVVVEELGIQNALPTSAYYVCSLLIFFLLLSGLPFAGLYCKKNRSLSALLHSRGVSDGAQVGGEFLALALGLLALVGAVLCGLWVAFRFIDTSELSEIISADGGCPFLAFLLPVLMITAFSYMIFELSGTVIGGILAHFFLTVGLCYLSGCFYPLYAFPQGVQKVASFLPVCVLREQMAQFFTGESSLIPGLKVLAYTAAFLGIAVISKRCKYISRGGK